MKKMTEIGNQKNDIAMSSETRLKKIAAKFKWTITDFQSLNQTENRRRFPIIQSSNFFLKDKEGEKSFQIIFHYDFKSLQLKSTPDLPKYTTISCHLQNQIGKILWQSHIFVPPLYRISLPPDFLINLSKTYSPESTLNFIFRIEIVEDIVSKISHDSTSIPVFGNFLQFLKNETICDVTFLIDNQELKAHKVILAARSPVFFAMFHHEFTEQRNNIVTIMDIKVEIFKVLLQYIYNDEIKNIENIADDLLIAADKYLMDDLKLKCEEVLISVMSKEKALTTIAVAVQCKCDNLEACCRFYLKQ